MLKVHENIKHRQQEPQIASEPTQTGRLKNPHTSSKEDQGYNRLKFTREVQGGYTGNHTLPSYRNLRAIGLFYDISSPATFHDLPHNATWQLSYNA